MISKRTYVLGLGVIMALRVLLSLGCKQCHHCTNSQEPVSQGSSKLCFGEFTSCGHLQHCSWTLSHHRGKETASKGNWSASSRASVSVSLVSVCPSFQLLTDKTLLKFCCVDSMGNISIHSQTDCVCISLHVHPLPNSAYKYNLAPVIAKKFNLSTIAWISKANNWIATIWFNIFDKNYEKPKTLESRSENTEEKKSFLYLNCAMVHYMTSVSSDKQKKGTLCVFLWFSWWPLI